MLDQRQRALNICTNIIVVAGLLTTSTLPGVYQPFLTDTIPAGPNNGTSIADALYQRSNAYLNAWFRALCLASFFMSIMAITGAFLIMRVLSNSSSDDLPKGWPMAAFSTSVLGALFVCLAFGIAAGVLAIFQFFFSFEDSNRQQGQNGSPQLFCVVVALLSGVVLLFYFYVFHRVASEERHLREDSRGIEMTMM